MPFHGLENNLKGQHLSWKYVYLNLKNDIKKEKNKLYIYIYIYIYNFNILNDYGDEWDKLQSYIQEYTK
jgi:hypothetical protein